MSCPQCQSPNQPGAQFCSNCGQALTSYRVAPVPESDSDGALKSIIPYKNSPALIAYYLGLFSILPLIGIPLGIAAVTLGILGLRKLKAEPRVKGKAHAYVGIGCGGLGALVWLGLLLLTLIPTLSGG